MRLSLLPLLRCPVCRRGRLVPESDDGRRVHFGPVTCEACSRGFPVTEGVIDLGPDALRANRSPALRAFDTLAVSRAWDRWLRPALLAASGGHRLAPTAEAGLVRGLLGEPRGPILDVGCGTGALLRALAERTELPPLIGLDVSRRMLDEALSLSREAGVPLSLVRAEAPDLPFRDACLGGAVQSGSLSAMRRPEELFRELFRVLMPGARYVLLEWLRVPGLLQRRFGLLAHGVEPLRAALLRTGFSQLEVIEVRPYRIFQMRRP